MSKETRQAHSDRLAVLASVQGHDSTIAHAFNHTNGACPKCGFQQQMMCFCLPGSDLPRVRGCELDGEHLHRLCAACKYPWVERCLDQFMLTQERGEMTAESEISAALAALAHRAGGLSLAQAIVGQYQGWIIHFERDSEQGTLTISAVPAPPQKGKPVHPDPTEREQARPA